MPFPRLEAFLLALSAFLLILSLAVSKSVLTQLFVSLGFIIFLARTLSYASRIDEDRKHNEDHPNIESTQNRGHGTTWHPARDMDTP